MKKIKIMAVIVALITAAAILPGCKKDSSGTSSTVGTGPKKYEKQVEIKIPIYDRGAQGQAAVDNNYWTQWIQKNFGDKYNIKVTYVPIPRTTDVDKFNMLLASGTAPDIIFSYDYPTIMSFNSRGAFQEIPKELLKNYGADFVKWAGDSMKYGVVDGKQMFLTATRPDSYTYTTLIRQDWLDKAGLKMPTSLTEYEQALLKFKELKLGGNETIPLTFKLIDPTGIGSYPYRDYPLSEKDNALYSDITAVPLNWEPVHQQLKLYNKFYNEGIISPEWALDKDGKNAQADFMNGKGGVYGFYLSQTPPVLQTLKQNDPNAKVAVLDPKATAIDSKDRGSRKTWPFGMLSGINKNCKNPEAVVMFLNWMCQKDVLNTLQNGIEGKTYKLQDGIPMITDYNGTERLNYNSNKDMWCLVTEGKDYGSEEKNLAAARTTYAPAGFEDLIDQSYKYFQDGKSKSYTDFLFDKTISASTTYNNTLKAKWEQIQVKLIQAKPSEFENLYKDAVKEYLASGYQNILDEKSKVYNEMKSKK